MADGDRLHRFQHLERPRPADGALATLAPSEAASRIGAVEQREEAAAVPPPATDGHLDRFRPAPDRSLELADRVEGAQPFVRCAGCETDNSVFAARCTTCGAELDTAAQRAFNERLWSARGEEQAREAADLEERRRAAAAADEEAARASRTLAEQMAREVGDAERQRLDLEDFRSGSWGSGEWGGGDPTPLGLRLLRLLPNPAWRVCVGVTVGAGLGLLILAGFAAHRGRPVAAVAFALLVLLIIPRGRRRGWSRWF